MQDHTEQLLDYVHGRLDATARAKVQASLEANPSLQAELAAIRAIQAEMAKNSGDKAARDLGWQRLSAAIDADQIPAPANDNRRFSLLQVAAVAAIAVIGVELLSYTIRTTNDAGFVPASVTADGPTLQIAFRPDARVDAVNDLLRSIGASLVDGPSALGLLTVQFDDVAARDAAQAVLAQRTDMVDLVSQP